MNEKNGGTAFLIAPLRGLSAPKAHHGGEADDKRSAMEPKATMLQRSL